MPRRNYLVSLLVGGAFAVGLPGSAQATSPRRTDAVSQVYDVVYSRETIQTLVDLWPKRDGAMGGEISDVFCDSVIANPNEFFGVMARNKAVFAEWVESLADLSFVDYGSCRNPNCLRKAMISVLEKTDVEAPETLKSGLLKKLKAIKVRTIN